MEEIKNNEVQTQEQEAPGVGEPAQPVGEAKEAAPREPAQPEVSEASITIAENGELNIPDSFWEDDDQVPQKEIVTEGREAPEVKAESAGPAEYTPQELAEAFTSGKIEEKKLPDSLKEYYKAIEESRSKRQQAQQYQPPQPPNMNVNVPPPPMVTAQELLKMTPQESDTLFRLGREVAERRLGLEPGKFDEFDPKHTAFQNAAMQAIQLQALQMKQNQALQVYNQQKQAAYAQAVYQNKVAIANELQKDTNFAAVNQHWNEYSANLPVKDYAVIMQKINSGNPALVKEVYGIVAKDYENKTKGESKKPQTTAPPPVMGASGGNAEPGRGLVDVSSLGDMSMEEKAAFLIKNGLVKI